VSAEVDVEVVSLSAGGGFGANGAGEATEVVWSGRRPAKAIELPVAEPVLAQGSTYAWRARSGEGKPWVGPWAFTVDTARISTAPTDQIGGVGVNLLSGIPSTSWTSNPFAGAAGVLRIGAAYRPGTAATAGLPAGWAWILPGSGLIRLTESEITGGSGEDAGPLSVTISSGEGAGPTFVRTETGAYVPGLADGTATSYATGGVLTRVQPGVWELASPDGRLVRFEGGRVSGEWFAGVPVAAFTWDDQGRLQTLTDGVEGGRSMSITYGGGECSASGWEGFSVADGLWCAVTYPDGTTTQVGYLGESIGMIADAGGIGIGFGWDDAGRLARVRGVGSTMAAATDAAWRVDETASTIEYDGSGRVQAVMRAAIAPGGSRLRHVYSYPSGQDDVLRAQVVEEIVQGGDAALQASALGKGVASIVEARSDTWQTLKSTGGDGLTSTMEYDPATGALAMGTATTGRVTSMASDAEGLASSSTGPYLGSSSGALKTERTFDSTVLDPANAAFSQTEGWQGLAATVWSGDAPGGAAQWWNRSVLRDGLKASFDSSPTGVSSPWRAQATGLWRLADGGEYRIEITASRETEVDLTIDGARCVDSSGAAGCAVRLKKGDHFVTVAASASDAKGTASFTIAADGPGVSGPISLGSLRPNYNAATRIVTNDVVDGRNLGSKAFDFTAPWGGAPSKVTAPGGLTTAFTYEATDASRGEFGRPRTMTTPGGSKQSMTYFAVGESATDPCTGTSYAQSGQQSSTTRYDGVVVSSVYDSAGRVVATTTQGGGASEVACFAYDVAGRLIESSVTGIDGKLREKTTLTYTMDKGLMTQVSTTTLGEAAPLQPGGTFTTTTVINSASQVVEVTEPNGTRTVREYNVEGDPTRRAVYAPGADQPTLDVVTSYDKSTGWLSSIEANGTTLADVTYDSYGLPTTIEYAGDVKATVAYDTAGSASDLVLTAGEQQVSQSRTRNSAGRTLALATKVRGDKDSGYKWSYTYDSAGRLTGAELAASGDTALAGGGDRSLSYSYGKAPQGCSQGAGADLERTGGARDGKDYQTCRDERGRLDWTTDPHLAGKGERAKATYDELGRLTALSGTVPLEQTWWYGTQLSTITEGSTDADRLTTTMLTAGGVLLERAFADAAGTTTTRYGYGDSDQPTLILDGSDAVLDIRVALPGGALAHLTPEQPIAIEHTDLYGSALATTRDDAFVGGGLTGVLGPYGEPMAEDAAPSSATTGIGTGTTYGFQAAVGNPTVVGHHAITVSARPYHPWLGEFLAFDPVVGASTTGYGYGDGNPVDKPDFSGGEGLWDLVGVAGAVLAAVGGIATGNINVRTSTLARVAAIGTLAVGSAAAIAGVAGTWTTGDSTTASAITTALAAVGMVIAGHSVASKILSDRANNQLLRQYSEKALVLAEKDAGEFWAIREAKRLDLHTKPSHNQAERDVLMNAFRQADQAYNDVLDESMRRNFFYVSVDAPLSFKSWLTGLNMAQ
jgi:YD repeat-containing protein